MNILRLPARFPEVSDIFRSNGSIIHVVVNELILSIGAEIRDLDLEVQNVVLLIISTGAYREKGKRNAAEIGCEFNQFGHTLCSKVNRVPVPDADVLTTSIQRGTFIARVAAHENLYRYLTGVSFVDGNLTEVFETIRTVLLHNCALKQSDKLMQKPFHMLTFRINQSIVRIRYAPSKLLQYLFSYQRCIGASKAKHSCKR